MNLADLPNLGPKSAAWLTEVGITTVAELAAAGSIAAYQRVKARFPKRASLNLLYGLEAALRGMHWLDMTPDFKRELREAAKRADTSSPAAKPRAR